jgi:maltooligosyltrehalose trehalohydrolase
MRRWSPSLGAWPTGHGTKFRVWAPSARSVDLVLEAATTRAVPMEKEPGGFFSLTTHDEAGTRYRYRLDGGVAYPDPCSRFQPEGVHGPSQVVDPSTFRWSDAGWAGVKLEDLILYELHVGTFTGRGTFAAVVDRLPHLVELGVTAIEMMPIAECPGDHNWGYDAAALFAPERRYGTPDDLRRLVDACHTSGLGVYLDVVYNHLGPDGAYLAAFAPPFFSARHRSPWGAGVNLDGPESGGVRGLLIENALYWLHEFHVDGLRLDATHALRDDGPRHFLSELADSVHDAAGDRAVNVIAEDERNLAALVREPARGGWGLDAVWSDDFHHEVHAILTGEHEGYYGDFAGRVDELATIVNRGWLYTGQYSAHAGAPRGTEPGDLWRPRLVVCLQNHDQVGNRAHGERLSQLVDRAAYRAASALLYLVPDTVLLFMGQEWGASTPFLYFTDHEAELGRQVSEGRRAELARFSAFSAADARQAIPDPQERDTFEASRLRWDEIGRESHAATLRLYRALAAMRRTEPALAPEASCTAEVLDEGTLLLRRQAPDGRLLVGVVRLTGRGGVAADTALPGDTAGDPEVGWRRLMTTEDPAFAPDPNPLAVVWNRRSVRVEFHRPAAVVLASR